MYRLRNLLCLETHGEWYELHFRFISYVCVTVLCDVVFDVGVVCVCVCVFAVRLHILYVVYLLCCCLLLFVNMYHIVCAQEGATSLDKGMISLTIPSFTPHTFTYFSPHFARFPYLSNAHMHCALSSCSLLCSYVRSQCDNRQCCGKY